MAAMQMLRNAPRSPPPEGDSMQGQLRSLLIAMLILPSIVILIRFWSRSLLADSDTSSIRAKYWWDDWTALAAAVCSHSPEPYDATGSLKTDAQHRYLGSLSKACDPWNGATYWHSSQP